MNDIIIRLKLNINIKITMVASIKRLNTTTHYTNNNDNNNNKNPGQVYIDKSLFYCSFNKIYSSASILFDDDNYVTTSKIYTSSPTPISLKRRDSPLNWRKSVHEMRGAHIITKKKESLVSHG